MMKFKRGHFPSANDDAKRASCHVDSPQCQSSSYQLAFQDTELMLRDELRPVRLQLEMFKPELVLSELGIESTVVIFGSARLLDPETAWAEMEAAESAMEKDPHNVDLEAALKRARRSVKNSRYYDEARTLGRLVAENADPGKYVVTTGGGDGIMGAANRGAHDVGAKNIGLNIVLPFEQSPNPYITPELCFQFHYFAIRKMHFLMRAKALIAFPGGFGTLDELFEALTLLQTRKINKMPILLFGREFWHELINFEFLVEQGTISESDLDLFQYVSTAEEAWDIIKNANGMANTPKA
ncbi:MAG: TIGR00730 family Rossman fold protein [Deltaproteobacteria bacterium]|nr:MAG: TIGR00730 family Rossman fold protein [Deltaproteobacteria bacterium]